MEPTHNLRYRGHEIFPHNLFVVLKIYGPLPLPVLPPLFLPFVCGKEIPRNFEQTIWNLKILQLFYIYFVI